MHASADTEAEAAPRVWIVAERHVVAAEGEAVDLGPMTAMPMEPKPSTVPLLSTSKGLSAALEAVKMPTLWPAETRMVKLSLVKVNEPGPPVVVTVPPLTIDTRLPFAAVPAAAKIPISAPTARLTVRIAARSKVGILSFAYAANSPTTVTKCVAAEMP